MADSIIYTPKFKAGDIVCCVSSRNPNNILVYEILALKTRREVDLLYPEHVSQRIKSSSPQFLEVVYVVRWINSDNNYEDVLTFERSDIDTHTVLYNSPEGIMMRL